MGAGELDLTCVICVLCHAEIEAYMEDIILEVVSEVFDYWNNDKTKIPEISSILHVIIGPRRKKKGALQPVS